MNVVGATIDDEREDGEIVDDFDEISDYSIPSSGKSDSSQNILRAISLSSISASEPEYNRKDRHRKRKHYLPPRKKRRDHEKAEDVYKRSKHYRRSLSSSSDSEELDHRTLRRKLKEAVRINTSQEMHHNSLRTRLKAMIDPDSQEDEEINALRTIALMTSNDIEKVDKKEEVEPSNTEVNENVKEETLDDQELNELRLEALKSAVIKKHLERQRRKEVKTTNQNNIEKNDVNNKENTKNNIIVNDNNSMNDMKNTKEPENVAPDDDPDVMRAILLASMSSKITAPKSITTKNLRTSTPIASVREVEQLKISDKLKQKNALINSKVTVNNKLFNLPSVKPLIINLKSDTESEPENNNESNVNQSINEIDKTVSELLKKQRHQYEAKIKTKAAEITTNEVLDKSVVKLLSKSQQREYQILKQKLVVANKKRKLRKLSGKINSVEVKTTKDCSEARKNNLKTTLEKLQVEKDGRLQMKGKYKELEPLTQKVNFALAKRKQCADRVKFAIKQLNDARSELDSSHQTYTVLVHQLSQAMENIDKRENSLIVKSIKTIAPKLPKTVKTDSEENPKKTNIDSESCENKQEDKNFAIVEEKINCEKVNTNYVSPLDSRIKTSTDPLQMLCPYELFGVCKDSECNFKHCP